MLRCIRRRRRTTTTTVAFERAAAKAKEEKERVALEAGEAERARRRGIQSQAEPAARDLKSSATMCVKRGSTMRCWIFRSRANPHGRARGRGDRRIAGHDAAGGARRAHEGTAAQ